MPRSATTSGSLILWPPTINTRENVASRYGAAASISGHITTISWGCKSSMSVKACNKASWSTSICRPRLWHLWMTSERSSISIGVESVNASAMGCCTVSFDRFENRYRILKYCATNPINTEAIKNLGVVSNFKSRVRPITNNGSTIPAIPWLNRNSTSPFFVSSITDLPRLVIIPCIRPRSDWVGKKSFALCVTVMFWDASNVSSSCEPNNQALTNGSISVGMDGVGLRSGIRPTVGSAVTPHFCEIAGDGCTKTTRTSTWSLSCNNASIWPGLSDWNPTTKICFGVLEDNSGLRAAGLGWPILLRTSLHNWNCHMSVALSCFAFGLWAVGLTVPLPCSHKRIIAGRRTW